jgi:hypothetical protein
MLPVPRHLRLILAAVPLALACGDAFAVLGVSPLGSRAGVDLAQALAGCGITIADVRYHGSSSSAGFFSTTQTGVVGFNGGVILSSGHVGTVVGPNNSKSAGTSLGLPGDSDLTALAGKATYDATVLEFDFIPSSTEVTFQYVFASDEYNEYVNSSFNDAFAFYLNGVNLAVVPGTGTPVTVNNVNNGYSSGAVPPGTLPSNPAYYINNSRDFSATVADPRVDDERWSVLEMDGLTVVMTVTATVVAGQINRMKFAIADASDSVYDSVVFIRAGSFSSGGCSGSGSGTTTARPPPPKSLDLDGYPNPWRPGKGGANDAAVLTMRNVPLGGAVRIYTTTGALVRELQDSDGDGIVTWDGRNSSGQAAASGTYLMAGKGKEGTLRRGKVVIIR